MTLHLTISLTLLSIFAACATSGASADADKTAVIGDNLQVPDQYRTRYQFLGAWSVAAAEPGAKELHAVYASPGAIDGYRRDGRFPDSAVLVKEVFETTTEPMSTGTVSRANKLKGWFMMVKDGAGAHSTKLWGDGWGWSWFDASNPNKTTSSDYKSECIPCHTPAQSSDWIYTQGYPVLTP